MPTAPSRSACPLCCPRNVSLFRLSQSSLFRQKSGLLTPCLKPPVASQHSQNKLLAPQQVSPPSQGPPHPSSRGPTQARPPCRCSWTWQDVPLRDSVFIVASAWRALPPGACVADSFSSSRAQLRGHLPGEDFLTTCPSHCIIPFCFIIALLSSCICGFVCLSACCSPVRMHAPGGQGPVSYYCPTSPARAVREPSGTLEPVLHSCVHSDG